MKDCSGGCLKYMLFGFNFVFWAIGCIMIALGIWFLIDSNYILNFIPQDGGIGSSRNMVVGLGAGIIVVGIIVMVTGFLGCCGALRENRCLLTMFFIVLLIIFVAMLVEGAVLIAHKYMIKDLVKDILDYEVKKSTQEGLMKWANEQWNCCGVESTGKCSQAYPPATKCPASSDKCKLGCLDAIWDNMMLPMSNKVGIVLIVTCFVLVAGMVFSMCLCCKINSEIK